MKYLIKKWKYLGSYFFIIFFLLIHLSLKAQVNLVLDPSFEDTTACYDNLNINDPLIYWQSLDTINILNCGIVYFHKCASVYGLPINQWCNQEPKNGFGILDLNFYYHIFPGFHRSVARSKLKAKLIAGQTYCAKLFVNPTDRYSRYTQDGIAMYFDNGQLDTILATDSSGIYPFVQPQVSNPQGNIITDTVGWTQVSGTFVANGTEEFITIGNFKTDANTDTAVLNQNFTYQSCELLIEDVSLYPINASNWLHDASGPVGDSVLIGLPNYEVPDGQWFTYNMQPLGVGSQIKVQVYATPTRYIQAIDVCNSMVYDTMEVSSWALGIDNSLDSYPNENAIQVFPNPSSGIFNINVSPKLLGQQIIVQDITGKEIMQLTAKPQNEISLQGYASGIYFVMVGGITKKIFKQ
jgi:Secretion system C-terminal sorting domain